MKNIRTKKILITFISNTKTNFIIFKIFIIIIRQIAHIITTFHFKLIFIQKECNNMSKI